MTDLPHLFSSFLIDLREKKNKTTVAVDKPALIRLFTEHLAGNLSSALSSTLSSTLSTADSAQKLREVIYPSTATQYARGI